MPARNAVIRSTMLALFLTGVIGCGSDSDSGSLDSSEPLVNDVRVDPASIKVGEQAQVRVVFTPRVDTTTNIVTDEEESVTREASVVIRLPEGLDYVDGSSRTDTSAVSGPETRNPNSVEICADNSRAITYHFEGRDLSTFADNQIIFVAQAYQEVGTVLVEGYASLFISDPCGVVGEAVETITVTAP